MGDRGGGGPLMIDPPITKLAAFFWLAVRFNRFPPTNRPYIPTKKGIAKNIEKKPLKKNKEITKKKDKKVFHQRPRPRWAGPVGALETDRIKMATAHQRKSFSASFFFYLNFQLRNYWAGRTKRTIESRGNS